MHCFICSKGFLSFGDPLVNRSKDYPFTTLVPQLGVVKTTSADPFVIADIPGIIEGAAQGAGLGIQFLRHLTRTRIILHLVDIIDCQLETLMPSFNDLKKAINNYKGEAKKLVIMLSDIGGIINPDIEKIAKFCKEKNIILIEDSAHSFGATLNSKFSGTFGNAGVYSYYSTKAIFAGEGGIVVTDNDNIGNLMKDFIAYDRFKQKMEIGCNIRLPELQALMIYSVVKEYQQIIKNKFQIAEKYLNVCKSFNIKYIEQNGNLKSGNYYKFTIISPNKKILDLLPKIKTTTSKVYDYSLGKSKDIPEKHLCLPIWFELEDSISDAVVNEIKDSAKKF